MKATFLASILLCESCCHSLLIPSAIRIPALAVRSPRHPTTMSMENNFNNVRSTTTTPSSSSLTVLKSKLTSTGRAGLLAYGMLNFAYYSIVTAVAWYFAMTKYPFPAGLDFPRRIQLTVAKLGSVAGVVWAGSQVTKVFRLSGAVVLAPVVDNLMAWCQTKFKLKSRNSAFWLIVAGLWSTLLIFYSMLIFCGAAVGSIVVL